MTTGVRTKPSSFRSHRAGEAIAVALVTTIVATLVLLSPAAVASSYGPSDPVAWSNGTVLCQFAPTSPSVAVSQAGVGSTGVTLSLASLVELTPGRTTVGAAELTGLSWSASNLSTDDAYDLAYSAHTTLFSPSGGTAPIGSVELLVQFVLPAYEGADIGPTDQVAVVISIVDWTWQNESDHLELTFGVAPSFPASEHLNATGAPGWILAGTSNSTGQVLEQVGANSSAQVLSPSGPSATIAANASLVLPSPSWAEVAVAFGSSAGTYSSLTYTAHVGVVLPAKVAGIPISELAAVAAAGVLVSLAVAAVTRRLRRRPSKLIYATEEGQP